MSEVLLVSWWYHPTPAVVRREAKVSQFKTEAGVVPVNTSFLCWEEWWDGLEQLTHWPYTFLVGCPFS